MRGCGLKPALLEFPCHMSHLSRRQLLKGSLVAATAAGIPRLARAADAPSRLARLPRVAGPVVNIYKPEADVYTLPTVSTSDGHITYTQGARYPDWRTNDHTFIKGADNRWHCFGITKPWTAGDNGHGGEGLCFHAVAPEGSFAQACTFQAWRDLPKLAVGDCGWAPAAVKIGHEYSLIGSHLGRATSQDLLAWTDQGKLTAKGDGRDPYLMRWDDTWYLLRCAGNGISLVTSTDFLNWTDPVIIYQPARASYQTESPVMIPHDGRFYLFWTLWDTADKTTSGYCPRSYVHCSETPLDFRNKPVLAEFTVHAPEIIQDEGGQWFISSTDHPHRGVSVAPLVWE